MVRGLGRYNPSLGRRWVMAKALVGIYVSADNWEGYYCPLHMSGVIGTEVYADDPLTERDVCETCSRPLVVSR
jgi:hypothetical protein